MLARLGREIEHLDTRLAELDVKLTRAQGHRSASCWPPSPASA